MQTIYQWYSNAWTSKHQDKQLRGEASGNHNRQQIQGLGQMKNFLYKCGFKVCCYRNKRILVVINDSYVYPLDIR